MDRTSVAGDTCQGTASGSTQCLMALIVAVSALIDIALIFELVNIINAGHLIRPAICATLLSAGLLITADEFSRRAS